MKGAGGWLLLHMCTIVHMLTHVHADEDKLFAHRQDMARWEATELTETN